jgi:hypothetical protein
MSCCPGCVPAPVRVTKACVTSVHNLMVVTVLLSHYLQYLRYIQSSASLRTLQNLPYILYNLCTSYLPPHLYALITQRID